RRDRSRPAERVRGRAARGLQEAPPHRVRDRVAAKRRQQGADERAPAAVQRVMETLGQLLDATAARLPDREAVAWAPHGEVTARMSWLELSAASRIAAKKLLAAGAGKGTRV